MNKKALIICVTLLVALMAAAAVGVAFLFSDDAPASSGEVRGVLYNAVPADAVAQAHFSSLRSAVETFNDSSVVIGTLFAGSGNSTIDGFMKMVGTSSVTTSHLFRNSETSISLHFSGSLVPLVIIDAGAPVADTTEVMRTLFETADSCGLSYGLIDASASAQENSPLKKSELILISPSATLITASKRHVESGASVLDSEGFVEAAEAVGGKDAIFFSHEYADKLLETFVNKDYSKHSSFFKKAASWTSLAIEDKGSTSLAMTGAAVHRRDQSCFLELFSSIASGESRISEVMPSSSVFAIDIPVSKIAAYCSAYRLYLDAVSHLDNYKESEKAFKSTVGMTPTQWATSLDIKEISKIVFATEDGLRSVLAFRRGKDNAGVLLKDTGLSSIKESQDKVLPFAYAGFSDLEFGRFFSVSDESSFMLHGDWIIVGDESALALMAGGKTMETMMGEAGLSGRFPSKGGQMVAYFCPSASAPIIETVFKPTLAKAVRHTMNGVTFEPMILSLSSEGRKVSFTADMVNASKILVASISKDTVVNIPTGPFKVKNSETGRTNLFAQNSNMYLTLSDENGKGIWGVPFKTPICGNVESVDFYDNGKLQFLFASGSRLYLIDRLGRFVNPFPVDLGKEVLLGPAVFKTAGGYEVMILHKDNSIVKYDLKGNRNAAWKDIRPDDTIKTLPEQIEVGQSRYWVIRTASKALIYGCDGGEPLATGTGAKSIRPDSVIEVTDKGSVSATCLDGKKRTFKLE